MRLRIVAGELGGRFIQAPPGRGTRPTASRVREAWFSALAGRIPGARVLDLFAGSGALGIEALSRGAAYVHFVEADTRAADVLTSNLHELGLEVRSTASRSDVFVFLGALKDRGERFDVALADPPYGGQAAERLAGLFREDPFAELLCIEQRAETIMDRRDVVWERRYGNSVLSFLAGKRSANG